MSTTSYSVRFRPGGAIKAVIHMAVKAAPISSRMKQRIKNCPGCKEREAWLDRAGPYGEVLTVNAAGGPVTGSFAGLDDNGALLIDDAGGRQLTFSFGDVTFPAKDNGA